MLGGRILLALGVTAAAARNFSICQEWSGEEFLDNFYFWKYNDPTRGKVDYVDRKTAGKKNLTYVDQNTGRFVMTVDHGGDPVPLNGNKSDLGRQSVRLHSNHVFGDGVYIIKVSWMPQGCGYAEMVVSLPQYLAGVLDVHTKQLAEGWRNRHCRGCQWRRRQPCESSYGRCMPGSF